MIELTGWTYSFAGFDADYDDQKTKQNDLNSPKPGRNIDGKCWEY